MAIVNIQEYLKLVPALSKSPTGALWSSYDREADTLYINFKKPSVATDSELTPEDVIIRYEGREIIGLTILHAASARASTVKNLPLELVCGDPVEQPRQRGYQHRCPITRKDD